MCAEKGFMYLEQRTRVFLERKSILNRGLEEELSLETKVESPKGHGLSDSSVICVIQITLIAQILLGLI